MCRYESVHTHTCSRDLTLVTSLVQQAPLHTQLSCPTEFIYYRIFSFYHIFSFKQFPIFSPSYYFSCALAQFICSTQININILAATGVDAIVEWSTKCCCSFSLDGSWDTFHINLLNLNFCVFVDICVCQYTCACVWRSEVDIMLFSISCHLISHFLKEVLSLRLEFTDFPSTGMTGMHLYAQPFMLGLQACSARALKGAFSLASFNYFLKD